MDKGQTFVISSSSKDGETPAKRHCAYCLVEVTEFKTCGKCHRRAYCSRECQALDWTVGKKDKEKGGVGQGHKKWCGINYGEEDLDWEVVPVPGKGLGIRALRDMEPFFRIIVEGWLTKEDVEGNPRIAELAPEGEESNEWKFFVNSADSFGGDGETGPGSIVGLRLSRVNHDCNGNASSNVDIDHNVMILYAIREIKAGEEISFNYFPFNDIQHQLMTGERLSPLDHRHSLLLRWSIVCPKTCICYDADIQKVIDRCFDRFAKCGKYDDASALSLSRGKAFIKALEDIIPLMGGAKCTPGMVCRMWEWIVSITDCDPALLQVSSKYSLMILKFFKKVGQ